MNRLALALSLLMLATGAATKSPREASKQPSQKMAKGPVMPAPPPVPLVLKAFVGQMTNAQGFYTNLPIQFDAIQGVNYSFYWTTDLQKSYGTTPNSTIVNERYAKWIWFKDWLCPNDQKAQFNIQVPSNHPPTFFVKIDAHKP